MKFHQSAREMQQVKDYCSQLCREHGLSVTESKADPFRIYLCMIILASVNKACFIFLQAMGKAAESTALSMVREVVFGVGFALLLPRFFGLDGVLYSMPLSDILTFLIAGYLILKTYRELSTKGEV